MFFPEALYALSARDHQVTWLDPVVTRAEGAAASAAISAQFTVPEARALLLQHALNTVLPGAGQNVTQMSIAVRRPGGSGAAECFLRDSETAFAANITGELLWTGSIVVPPGWEIIAGTILNAGVAVNTVRLNLAGILIPIANIARV